MTDEIMSLRALLEKSSPLPQKLKALSLTRNRIFPSAGESASPVNFAAADEEAALSPEDRQLACLVWDG